MAAQVEDSSPPGQFYCPNCEKNFQLGGECPNDGTKLMRLNVALDPLLGRDIDGRFTILEKLGQGGMGAVYRASEVELNREVAIKVVNPHLITDQDVVKRFLREAKLAGRLSHPNAVAVLQFGQTDDGLFFIVMELVSGRTLDSVLKAEKVLRPERVVRIGMQVCDALEGAHSLSIIHRDLKPANIMLLSKGRDLVKVLDFGLAKVVGPEQTSTTMTNAGALLGTPSFMPPELALGLPCDGRADLYSLGVVLYLAGSGRLPFVSDSPHELIAMHGTEEAPPMPGVPPALGAVIDRMLRKDPRERYQSAAENREALEDALEGRFTPLPGSISTVSSSIADASAVMNTPVPRSPLVSRGLAPRGKTDAAALGVSETLAALSGPQRIKKRRIAPILGGLVLASGVGVGAFMFVNNASEPKPAAVTQPLSLPVDATPVTTPAEPPPTQPTANVPAVQQPAEPPITDDTTKDTGKKDKKDIGKKDSGKKDTTKKDTSKRPPKSTPKPLPPPTNTDVASPHDATVAPPKPPPDPAGTGSGTGKGKMPF